MSRDEQDAPGMAPSAGKDPVFVGEEDVGGRSSPGKDLAAAIAIGLFALAAMYFALTLQVPDNLLTAPGLLPFLTAVTLLAMAVGLGVKAFRAGGSFAELRGVFETARRAVGQQEPRRALVLIATVVLYVVAVDQVPFELTIPTSAFVLAFSSYELISGIVLTFLLKLFWGAAILRCLLVAFVWIVILANIFRFGFHILLPGLA